MLKLLKLLPPACKHFLFGNKVFANVIKIGSHWIWEGPHPMTGVLIRNGKFGHRHMCLWRQKRRWCVCKPGTPRIAGSYQKLGEAHGPSSPSEPQGGIHSVHNLPSDCWPPDCEKIYSVVLNHLNCGNLYRKLIQQVSTFSLTIWSSLCRTWRWVSQLCGRSSQASDLGVHGELRNLWQHPDLGGSAAMPTAGQVPHCKFTPPGVG